MPEGDTLHRIAHVLGIALGTAPITAAEVHPRWNHVQTHDLVGRSVRKVESRGKNLLLHLEGDTVLWSHLRMTGSWHVYRPGEPWLRPVRQRSIALATDRAVAVGFNLPVLERMSTARALRHPALASLGPDLLSPDFDASAALTRFRMAPLAALGEALLDQRLACGIGNVYKSEALHLARLDPWQRVESTLDETLLALLERTRMLMRRNLDGHPRRTHHGADGDRYFVYGREGRPCRTCEVTIAMKRQGPEARSTYYCPRCQGVA